MGSGKKGRQVALAASTSRMAFAAVMSVDGKWGLGVAVENEDGYRPYLGTAPMTEAEARELANDMNCRLGLSVHEAHLIIVSTMFKRRRVR